MKKKIAAAVAVVLLLVRFRSYVGGNVENR